MKKILSILALVLIIYIPAKAQSTVELFEKAANYKQKWDYENTFKYLEMAEQSYPGNLQLEYYHATWLAEFSRYHEALKKFASLAKRRNDFKTKDYQAMLLEYAHCYFCADSAERGLKLLTNELEDNKYANNLLTSTAHLYFCVGNYDESLKYLMRSYEIDSTDSWVVYYIGKMAHYKGDSAMKKKFFDKTLAIEKEQDVCRLTPFVYCFTGKPKEAVKTMKAAVKKEPYSELNLGSVYGILGMKKECISFMKKYMKKREFESYYYISRSSDYASVQKEPEFIKLMEEIKEPQ